MSFRWQAADPWAGIQLTHVKVPVVTTGTASSITTSSFTMGGEITDTGGENVSERGFAYMVGTAGDPTTANSTAFATGSFAAGTYTQGLSGLAVGTSYRVRAYAINTAGTGYGTSITVTTASNAPPSTPVITAPADLASVSGSSVSLEATVTDPASEDVYAVW